MSEYVENVVEKQNRQILFNMPLDKAVALFSVLLFVLIAVFSSIAYYFAMKNILSENSRLELKQTINNRQFMLNAKLDREILLMEIFQTASPVKAFFANPNDEHLRKVYFAMLDQYKDFFHSKALCWISTEDMNYYVNKQFMEKYDSSNEKHSWFFKTLTYEHPPLIKVDFDYLNRQIYDIYIDYPIHFNDEAVGAICSRISLFEFMHDLDLPENILVFGRDGVVIGAKDEKIAKEKKTLKELFGPNGEEVYEKALSLKEDASDMISIENKNFLIKHTEKLDLFLLGKYEIDMEEILEERASKVFFILLLIMLLAFIVFNRFIAHILKPMNRNMQSYVESSLFDELTKIPNRRFFNMKMEDEMSRAARAEYPISCMMMDIDKFKSYNDTYGHAGGDALLREAAKVFKNSLSRAQDFIARVGGEEFCVILPNTDLDGAKQVAERIRTGMEKTGKATISIGLICRIPTRRDVIEDLIKDADDKLYQAKNTGRNKVVF